MASIVRKLVASNKRRFVQDGFALDLSYVSPRIIAMGLPAEGTEGLYRNPLSEIVRFLSTYHLGKAKVFNLCAERCYSPSKLMVPVVNFPFEDHQTPSLELISSFCGEATEWLRSAPDAVVVVHCKAGKGRTGLMICCLLLSIAAGPDPALANTALGGAAWRPLDVNLGLDGDPVEEVLRLYASRRTLDGKGVTIASQRRYVRYFWDVLRRGGQPPPRRAARLRRISFSGLPPGAAESCTLAVSYRPQGSPRCLPPCVFHFHGPAKQGPTCLSPCAGVAVAGDGPWVEAGPAGDWLQVLLPAGAPEQGPGAGDADSVGTGGGCREMEYVVEGDVRVQLLRNGSSLCYTWFNTAYLPSDGHYTLLRPNLDKVNVPSDALALALTFEDARLAAISAPHPAQPIASSGYTSGQVHHAHAPALPRAQSLQQVQSSQQAPGSSKLAASGLSSSVSLPGSIAAFGVKGASSMWPWAGSMDAAAECKDAASGDKPGARGTCIELPVIGAQSGRSSISEDDVVAAVMWSGAGSAACCSPKQAALPGVDQQPGTVTGDVAVDWCGRVVRKSRSQHEGGDEDGSCDGDELGAGAFASPLSRLGSLLDSLELGWNATPVTAVPALQRSCSAPTTPCGMVPQPTRSAGMGQRSLSSHGGRGKAGSDAGMCTPLLASACYVSTGMAEQTAGDMAAVRRRSSRGSTALQTAGAANAAVVTDTPCPSSAHTATYAITPCHSTDGTVGHTCSPCGTSTDARAGTAAAATAAADASALGPAGGGLGPFGVISAPPSLAGPLMAAPASPVNSCGNAHATSSAGHDSHVSPPLLMSHLSEPGPCTVDLISFEEGVQVTAAAVQNCSPETHRQQQQQQQAPPPSSDSTPSQVATPIPSARTACAGASAADALAAAAAAAARKNRAATAAVPPAWRRSTVSPKQPQRAPAPQPQARPDVSSGPDARREKPQQHMGRGSADSSMSDGAGSEACCRRHVAARKLELPDSDSDLEALLPRLAYPDQRQPHLRPQQPQQPPADAGAVWQQLDEAWAKRWWV